MIDNDGVDTWDGYPSGGDPYRSKVSTIGVCRSKVNIRAAR